MTLQKLIRIYEDMDDIQLRRCENMLNVIRDKKYDDSKWPVCSLAFKAIAIIKERREKYGDQRKTQNLCEQEEGC